MEHFESPGAAYHLITMSPPSPPQVLEANDVFSKMGHSKICHCFSIDKASTTVMFFHSNPHLVSETPLGYMVIYSRFFPFLLSKSLSISQLTPNNFHRMLTFDSLCTLMGFPATSFSTFPPTCS